MRQYGRIGKETTGKLKPAPAQSSLKPVTNQNTYVLTRRVNGLIDSHDTLSIGICMSRKLGTRSDGIIRKGFGPDGGAWSIAGHDGPHSGGGGEGPLADGLLDGKGLHVTITKQVVKPAAMRFVHQQPLIDAVPAGWVLRNGSRVNLVQIAIGATSL